MKHTFSLYGVLLFLVVGILTIFVIRTGLATRGNVPRFNDLFTLITLVGSLAVLIAGYRRLQSSDWMVAIGLGAVVGVGMVFATLFSPYPFFGLVSDNLGQAFVRGVATTLAGLGGLAIMRLGGPVQVLAAKGEWRSLKRSLVVALAFGVPLALVNVFALRLTTGQPMNWQSPLAAVLDALQPGIVEEVIYRFAFLGLLWLALHKQLPNQAGWLAGLLSLLVHTYMHYDELFLQAPLVALGMGLVTAVFWGLPPTYLALRRGLEPAITFHWLQDVARFLAGY